MAMIQACSYRATIQTPLAPENYSAIVVTFSQLGTILVTKTKGQLTLQDGLAIVSLSQAETKLFTAGVPALMQCRCYRSEYDAPGSALLPIEVWPSNYLGVLPNG